jgi:hypothetical protein
MESDSGTRLRSQELGERYPRLLRRVVGFRAKVVETGIKFNLGRDDVYADIAAGLLRRGNPALADAMENINRRCPHPPEPKS